MTEAGHLKRGLFRRFVLVQVLSATFPRLFCLAAGKPKRRSMTAADKTSMGALPEHKSGSNRGESN
jgi:hypothetical protein